MDANDLVSLKKFLKFKGRYDVHARVTFQTNVRTPHSGQTYSCILGPRPRGHTEFTWAGVGHANVNLAVVVKFLKLCEKS